MPINRNTDLILNRYSRGSVPSDSDELSAYLSEELQRLDEFGSRQSSGTYSSYNSRGGSRMRGGTGVRGSGYGGNVTVTDIERMLPAGVLRNTPGVSSILQKRAIEAGMSKKDLSIAKPTQCLSFSQRSGHLLT